MLAMLRFILLGSLFVGGVAAALFLGFGWGVLGGWELISAGRTANGFFQMVLGMVAGGVICWFVMWVLAGIIERRYNAERREEEAVRMRAAERFAEEAEARLRERQRRRREGI